MIQVSGQSKVIEIHLEELLSYVNEMKEEKHRLVQISCTKMEHLFELYYSFERDYTLTHLKLLTTAEKIIPSISFIFQPAFLYENEIHDLFGLQISHIAVDYEGKLYKLAQKTPFADQSAQSGGQKHE